MMTKSLKFKEQKQNKTIAKQNVIIYKGQLCEVRYRDGIF